VSKQQNEGRKKKRLLLAEDCDCSDDFFKKYFLFKNILKKYFLFFKIYFLH